MLGLLSAFSCQERQKTPEELKLELMTSELSNWRKYVQLKDVHLKEDNHLFKPDEVIISGTVLNTATIAQYKDIQYKVLFYSKTKTVIGEKEYVVYDFLKPNSSIQINATIIPPKGYAYFDIQLINVAAS